MTLAITLAVKEILGNKKFTLIFIFNLSFALIAFLCLHGVRSGFESYLEKHAQALQTSDLSLEARRLISTEQQENASRAIHAPYQRTEVLRLYSMVASQSKSRLAEIQVIEDQYPFYSSIVLQDGSTINSESEKSICVEPQIWVYPEILSQLGASIGDHLTIGETSFEIAASIADDAQINFSQASFAPKIYLGRKFLEQTKLLQKGSTVRHTIHYKISSMSLAQKSRDEIVEALSDRSIQVRTPWDSDEDTSQNVSTRMLSYMLDYLGLVALTGLFLAALGIAYFYFSYFSKRIKDMGILLSLGLSPFEVSLSFYAHLLLLGCAAGSLSILVVAMILPLSQDFMSPFLPPEFSLSMNLNTSLIGLALSVLASLLTCYPLLRRISYLRPSRLFQPQSETALNLSGLEYLAFTPLVLFYWALSVWQAHSYIMGSLFMLGVFVAGLLLSLCFFALRYLFAVVGRRSHSFTLRHALLQIERKPFHALIAFVAMSLGVLLVNLVNQIENSLSREFSQESNSKRPSFFMFDIQDEQVLPLKDFLAKRDVSPDNLSPMIRARIKTINNNDFNRFDDSSGTQSRENQESQAFSNRSFNLSYRLDLDSSERITEGVPLVPGKHPMAQISLESRFASRLNLKLGDVIDFDISGVSILGKVTNLRQVKWSSFQPNFFIQFEPGVLDEAPKTWVTAIPELGSEHKTSLQNDLVYAFPNIAIIDVARIVAKVFAASKTMTLMLSVMAGSTLLVGMLILFSINHLQSQVRIWDMNLLKALGSPLTKIKLTYCLEFAILSLFASSIGSLLAVGFGSLTSNLLFESQYIASWALPVISTSSVTLVGTLSAYLYGSLALSGFSSRILGDQDR